ncbi:MAG: SDR family NAD(P)-dependent oxidoreductase [Planctomycetota bacterium]
MSGPRRVLITGATSAIARALADRLAARGDRIVLAARDDEEAGRTANDLRLSRGAEVFAIRFDAEEVGAGKRVVETAAETLGGLDGVYVVHGAMWPQEDAERDPTLAARMAVINLASPAEILHAAADRVPDKTGFLCAVSSVAGDRGRPSNFAYGAGKAGLDALCHGLRGRLLGRGVRVTLVKPGFVDTAMTWGLSGMFLVAPPERVAASIDRAAVRGKAVVYTPFFWRWIMLIIRLIPRPVFDRLGM